MDYNILGYTVMFSGIYCDILQEVVWIIIYWGVL